MGIELISLTYLQDNWTENEVLCQAVQKAKSKFHTHAK